MTQPRIEAADGQQAGRGRACAWLIALLLFSPLAAADVLEEATALIEADRPAEAYELLSPLEEERAGDPDYDLLLGLSALNAGDPGIAVFAFERVLAVEPDNARARAELARAYFELHENEASRQEFENVQNMVSDEQVEQTIRKYLDALNVRFQSESQLQWAVYVEGGGGYDSNVNSATDNGTFATPGLVLTPVTILDADSTAQDDVFLNGKVGGWVAYRLAESLTVFALASLDERLNPSEDTDLGTIDGQLGARYEFARSSLTGSFQGQRFEVDNNLFRSVTGGNAQWQVEVDPRNRVSVFGQFAELDYHPAAQDVRDAFLKLVGLGWAHSFEGKGSPTMFASAYLAQEDERPSATIDNSLSRAGLLRIPRRGRLSAAERPRAERQRDRPVQRLRRHRSDVSEQPRRRLLSAHRRPR